MASDRRKFSKSAAGLALAALALAAGCGSSSKHGASPTSRPSGAGTTTTTILNNVSLRKNVTLSTCARAPGGWSAEGTAVGVKGKATSYKITIFFVTVPGDTVEGSGVKTVSVPAGQIARWTVTGRVKSKSTMQCVLRGVG